MPEGNVIHNQARRLNRAFRGQIVRVDSPQGRFAQGARAVDGHVVTGVWARGKHLFIDVSPPPSAKSPKRLPPQGGLTIHVHLGLFGKWRLGKGAVPAPQGEIRLRLWTDERFAELRGPTVCELLDPQQVAAAVSRIGPDPLDRDADPGLAWRRMQRSSAPIAAVLMDQRTFAGVGNIYRAEILFRHGMSPFRPARAVTREEFDGMWADLVLLMAVGARRGRIDTVRAEHLPDAMGRPAREDRHGGEVYVYRRDGQPCLLCGGEIAIDTLQARKLYWCPSCQAA